MPATRKKPKSPRRATAAQAVVRAADEVAALAWAGQQERAVEAATASLAKARSSAERMSLLDLRSAALLAGGQPEHALGDAKAMLDIGKRARKREWVATALCRQASIEIRMGRSRDAVATGEAALDAARRCGSRGAEAMALMRLGEAQSRVRDSELGARAAMQASRLWKALGDRVNEGRSWWVVSIARSSQGRTEDADRAAGKALALARQTGDLLGMGNALNMLTFHEADIAKCIALLRQALAAFRAGGHRGGEAMITHNLANQYNGLGLLRRSLRLFKQARDSYIQVGATAGVALPSFLLGLTEHELGMDDAAKAHLEDAAARWEAGGMVNANAYVLAVRGFVASFDGDYAAAIALAEQATRELEGTQEVAIEINAHDNLAEFNLAAGRPVEALQASTRATGIHRAHGLGDLQGITATEVWWHHHEALRASGKTADARRALAQAYRFLVDPISKLTDEGLRRNYLNKREVNRKIVKAWVAEPRRRPAHLAGESTLREPFERLVDTGLRLNELRTPRRAARIPDRRGDRAVRRRARAAGARFGDGPRARRVARAQGRRRRGAAARRRCRARRRSRRTRTASLRTSPGRRAGEFGSARASSRRSIARDTLLGYLYADIDGAFGRFHEADRDLLAMLASQAAVALDNAQWSQGLEQKVAQRTEELQRRTRCSSSARTSSRSSTASSRAWPASSTSRGSSTSSATSCAKSSLRATSASAWVDEKAQLIHHPLRVRARQAAQPPASRRRAATGRVSSRLIGARPWSLNTAPSPTHSGSATIPGTDAAKSSDRSFPIIGGDRVLGIISSRTTSARTRSARRTCGCSRTVAASMGVALENARLFDETQRLLKETEQRDAELAVINSIQQGMAAELDFQAIVDLVGDKLREVFDNGDIGIRWRDEQAGLIHYLYEYEHGVRLTVPPTPLNPERP